MIGKVSGRLDYRGADHVLVDTGGVGYLVYCSDRTLAALPSPGEAVALYTDLLVREDLMQLFGFLTLVERDWHRLLMSVQGVGAKAALAILGALGPEGLARALELKAKAPAMMALGAGPAPAAAKAARAAAAAPSAPAVAAPSAEALSALVNLGYAPGEAAAAVAEIGADPELDTAATIRAALKRLAPKV